MAVIQKPLLNGRSERAWTDNRFDHGLHGLFDQPYGAQGGCPGYRPDTIVATDDLCHGRRTPPAIYKYSIGLAARPVESAVKIKDIAPGFIEGKAAGCVTVGVLASREMRLDYRRQRSRDSAKPNACIVSKKRELTSPGLARITSPQLLQNCRIYSTRSQEVRMHLYELDDLTALPELQVGSRYGCSYYQGRVEKQHVIVFEKLGCGGRI